MAQVWVAPGAPDSGEIANSDDISDTVPAELPKFGLWASGLNIAEYLASH